MSEPMQGSGPVVPLPYASREEAADALWAYRLVGWYFLFVSVVAVVSAVAYAYAILQAAGMMSWLIAAQSLLVSSGPRILVVIGAIGMLRGRAWGAWAVIGVCGLRIVLASGTMAYQLLIAPRPVATGISFAVYSGITMMLDGCLHVFLAWAVWRFCRRRGAWN